MNLFENYKAKELITTSGTDQVGDQKELREFILHMLLGKNPRDFRENIIKSRILTSNAAILSLICEMNSLSNEKYIEEIAKDFKECKNNNQRTIPFWMTGLTKKGFDNIARKDFNSYALSVIDALNSIPKELEENFGKLGGYLELNGKSYKLDWSLFTRLAIPFYGQGLSIKGSEKSASGKLWERLVLGNILSIFGFSKLEEPDYNLDNAFWLSHEDEDEREVDATIIKNGHIICIDIGFIGSGNPEISLDKVTRFKNQKEFGSKSLNVSTIIIVDTISENSGIRDKAKGYNAHILEMNSPFWTMKLLDIIRTIFKDNTGEELFSLINNTLIPLNPSIDVTKYSIIDFNKKQIYYDLNMISEDRLYKNLEEYYSSKLNEKIIK